MTEPEDNLLAYASHQFNQNVQKLVIPRHLRIDILAVSQDLQELSVYTEYGFL